VVKNKPTINTQNIRAIISAGYILKILAQTKAIILFFSKKLLAIRNPLVIKNMSTAMVPKVKPREILNGSAYTVPIAREKLWLYKTSEAARKRIKLKLLSRLFVYFDNTVPIAYPILLFYA
jgi:hypothetical protein